MIKSPGGARAGRRGRAAPAEARAGRSARECPSAGSQPSHSSRTAKNSGVFAVELGCHSPISGSIVSDDVLNGCSSPASTVGVEHERECADDAEDQPLAEIGPPRLDRRNRGRSRRRSEARAGSLREHWSTPPAAGSTTATAADLSRRRAEGRWSIRRAAARRAGAAGPARRPPARCSSISSEAATTRMETRRCR